MACVWEVMRLDLLAPLHTRATPDLCALQREDEALSQFAEVSPEQLLLRWLNQALGEPTSGWPLEQLPITSWGPQLCGGDAFLCLLHHLDSQQCSADALRCWLVAAVRLSIRHL